MRRAPILFAVGLAVAATATTATIAASGTPSTRATLRLADGTSIGTVRFHDDHGTTRVKVSLDVPDGKTAVRAFHGFHIHANDDPVNGVGCLADPTVASSTWFVSADGHLQGGGLGHGNHAGDMPSLHLDSDGTAEVTFEIDRFSVADLAGRAVIVHAGPDNLGNVPVGAEPNQYTPNSQTALDRTAATGNAGDRIACGVIGRR